MKIWTKVLIKESLKVFLFFIFSLYFLYALIDYASRVNYYQSISFLSLVNYYLCIFSQKAELLIPFAFMVTIIKVLTSLNARNELVSMLMSGKSYKKLLMPLFCVAFSLSCVLALNFQFLEPNAQKKIQNIKRKKKSANPCVKTLVLEDGSKLVFSDYDSSNRALLRVYWIESFQKITYIKKLFPFSSPPIGHFTQTFFRDAEGKLKLIARDDIEALYRMKIDFDPSLSTTFTPKSLSLSELIYYLLHSQKLRGVDSSELSALLNYKIVFILTPLFILLTLAPFCTRFSRNIPSFLIYTLSIALMLFFYTLMDACFILSEQRLIIPQLGLWIPFALFFTLPIKRFVSY